MRVQRRKKNTLYRREREMGGGSRVEWGEMNIRGSFCPEWRCCLSTGVRQRGEDTLLGKKGEHNKEKEEHPEEESANQAPFPFHRFYDLGDIVWMTHNVRHYNVASCPWSCSRKSDYSTSGVFIKVSTHCNKWTQTYETLVGKPRFGSSHPAGGFFSLTLCDKVQIC